MERIKKLKARDEDTATYGETSLSDITDEEFEMMNHAVRIPVPVSEIQKRGGFSQFPNTLPQPKLAADHVATDVCFLLNNLFLYFFFIDVY